MNKVRVRKNEVFILTRGSYSSYMILGTFMALKDFNIREVFRARTECSWAFPKTLIDSGLAVELDLTEVNVDTL